MSRWGRGRGSSVALPLDSNLFRENSNCPSAARSAGTVGKWGITSFTSIRSSPYAFSSNVLKKPVQDQNSPLTVPAVETEVVPPKPKKFFKSRNVPDSSETPVPQISYAPPVSATHLSPPYPSHSRKEERALKNHAKKSAKSRSPASARDSSPETPRPRKKNTLLTKAAKKEEIPGDATQPPNKRYLVRNRAKVINYNEDRSNSPIPEISSTFIASPPKVPTPKSSPTVSSPSYVKPGLLSPTNKDGKPPPIVLRISKGTSRIVSTDSNEGFTSPGSDRHSSMDTHFDGAPDPKMSPIVETIYSPKHEGIKLTIKCSSFAKESVKKKDKKEKSEDKESGCYSRTVRSHKRNHRKNSDEEPLRRPSSPLPGTDNYDLYRTLASPAREEAEKVSGKDLKNKDKSFEEIESELAQLDSEEPTVKSPRSADDLPTEPPPEPKPPESSGGRAKRHRANINYNENDDHFIDDVTSLRTVKQLSKTASKEITKKEERKKSKRKIEVNNVEAVLETQVPEAIPENSESETDNEVPVNKNELLDILSGSSDGSKPESEQLKLKINKKHCLKNLANSSISPPPPEENNCDSESAEQSDSKDVTSPEAHVFKSPSRLDEQVPEDKPCVKLVITKKKGSIFKSKSLVNDNPSPLPARKRRHLYKHQWADDGKGNQTPRREPEPNAEAPDATNEVSEELRRVTRYRSQAPALALPGPEEDEPEPYTSIQCAKASKEYYTVVRNVKKAHQIQEIGEFQEFNDDVEYILDALQDNNPMSTRCLSAITLASKCTAPAFRMHVRAHGTVQKFFSALHDATNDQSLGLCTATVMFVLSQDRLNMDLDRESLELMLNLLESDVSHKNALDDCGLTSIQLSKNKERVRELCAEIKNQGKAKHLDLENITVGHLAMETLLSLTSKRAGEWFKEELRALGGVDHIVRTIQDCVVRLAEPASWNGPRLDTLRKADRCMRVLENVTQQNEENQLYLVTEERRGVAATMASLLRLCCEEAQRAIALQLETALLDAALPAIKVLVNLSHSFGMTASVGANVVGEQVSVMETCLILLNNHGNFVPDSSNFEFSVCVLLLLINLVQNNPANIERLLAVRIRVDDEDDIIETKIPALDLIVEHFYKREELARRAEENTDAILDGKEKEKEDEATDKKKQSQDDIEGTVAKLLAKAGAHMEHSMVGAYAALLLGHVACVTPALDAAVRQRVPCYAPLLPTLRKYYSFLMLTASAEAASVAHVKATQRIIDFMDASDKQRSLEASQTKASPPRSYAQDSPSDMPQDMSLSNLDASFNTNHSIDYSTSGSDKMSSSMDASIN